MDIFGANRLTLEQNRLTYFGVPMTAAIDMSGLSTALKVSLDNWAKHEPKYAALYKTLSKEVLSVAHAGLEEMRDVKPGGWESWWALNHDRFIRKPGVLQRELLLLHEIMYHFLTRLSRGTLDHEPNESRTTERKTKNKTKA